MADSIENLFSTLPVVDPTSEFQDMMSAHEAGHATLGITLGARIEAVYAICNDKPNPANGKIRLLYQTKFGGPIRAGLHLKDIVLFTAGGAAGEFLLNGGKWDQECVQVDRTQLEERAIWNFDYCAKQAIDLLQENKALLVAVRNKIRSSMSNLKQCRVARNGTHIILVRGLEIQRLFRSMGFSVSSDKLDLSVAKFRESESGD
jgi:hypothetical protein